MNVNCIYRAAAFLLLAYSVASSQPADPVPADIRAAAHARVDNNYTPGIIIGVIDKEGTHYYSYGHGSAAGDTINERTVFEIGSATKAFTGVLLAQMVERGDVRLNDPISLYLPQSAKVPASIGD